MFKHVVYLLLGATILAIMGMAGASAVWAYGWQSCDGSKINWSNGWTNMYISTTSFPQGSSWDATLQDAMWHWNNVKGSSFNFYVGRDTDGTHNNSNGRNEVYLDNSITLPTLAVTSKRYHCSAIDEADLGFNNNIVWNLGAVDYNNFGAPYHFETVALHELGHVLGLNHEDRWMATMNSFYPDSGPVGHGKEADPLPDDRAGVRFLYPDGTIETDIAGSVFARTGSGTSGLVAGPTSARRGSSVTIQFTFHNLSTSSQTFNIGFYLSTNNFISKTDRLLGTNTGASASPGATGTFTRTLTIPSDVAPGNYWLGFLLDYDERLSETNEYNNSMEMPRAIQIF